MQLFTVLKKKCIINFNYESEYELNQKMQKKIMMSFYCHWRENCTSQFLLRNYSKHLFLKMIFIPQIMIHLSSNIFMLTIIKIRVLDYSAFSQSWPNKYFLAATMIPRNWLLIENTFMRYMYIDNLKEIPIWTCTM